MSGTQNGGLSDEQRLARAEKLYAYRSQFFSDNELEQQEGPGVDSSLVDSSESSGGDSSY